MLHLQQRPNFCAILQGREGKNKKQSVWRSPAPSACGVTPREQGGGQGLDRAWMGEATFSHLSLLLSLSPQGPCITRGSLAVGINAAPP